MDLNFDKKKDKINKLIELNNSIKFDNKFLKPNITDLGFTFILTHTG